MYRGTATAAFTMPGEYRKAAERLFPRNGYSKSQKPDMKTINEFAKALGIGVEYQRLLALARNSNDLQVFLEHFQTNLELLIRKTWVEKSDENRKIRLHDKVPSIVTRIGQEDFSRAIEEFSLILDELAYLFFGSQSEKEDFTEYTFRIDAQMGLFWWYGSRLSIFKELNDEKILWALLLLGLSYLTNF